MAAHLGRLQYEGWPARIEAADGWNILIHRGWGKEFTVAENEQIPAAESLSEGRARSAYTLGAVKVRRSGYGAMQLGGPFAAGTPPDRSSAVDVLRTAVAAGVDHIDTAEYYGNVNELIREALSPYPAGLAIVSKVAARGDSRAAAYLRAGIEDNLRTLRTDQLAAVNLRLSGDGRVDARFDDELAAMVAARDDGLIAGIGLSNVSLEQLRHAAARTEIVCVQNMFHLADRSSAPQLGECLTRAIAFVPFCPLGWPRGQHNPVLTSPTVARAAGRLGFTRAQVALQWLLQLAPNVLLIPGTASVPHLLENLAAESLPLDDEALRALDGIAG
jgi:pyridoxine 4-dehydrogenase